MDLRKLSQQLQEVEHFRDIPLEEIKAIILAGQISQVKREQVIFSEETPSAGLYVLLKGQVQLCKISPQGQLSILSVIHPVIMFNEVPTLDGGLNPVTAIAVQDSTVWHISNQGLQKLIYAYPNIGLGLLKILAARNRKLVSQFQDLSFRSVLSRIAKLLLELSQHGQQPILRKEHPNVQMAARIATVPEAFSRGLKKLRDQGYIHCDRKAITIERSNALASVAEMDLLPGQQPAD